MTQRPNRPGQSRKHKQRTQRRPSGPRRQHDGDVVLSVLDQEAFAAARDTWPKSWTWNNADIYLEHIQQLAEGIDSQGGRPYYAFIEPAEYVQWCRQTGHQIDSSETRALYAHKYWARRYLTPPTCRCGLSVWLTSPNAPRG